MRKKRAVVKPEAGESKSAFTGKQKAEGKSNLKGSNKKSKGKGKSRL